MIAKGTYTIQISVFEQDGVTPFDLTNVTQILVQVYQHKSSPLGKFSLNTKTDYVPLRINSPSTAGIIEVDLQSSSTEKAIVDSKCKAQIVVYQTDGNFTNNTSIAINTEIELESFEAAAFAKDL